jgi:hypothetical protein
MSTGLNILSARYGVGSSIVDVKSAVSSQTKDGNVNFLVSPTSLNVEDPAPGQIKTLTVEYTINGGSSNSDSVKDGDYLKINAPPERDASGLTILKAQYGYDGNFTDVTDAIQNHLSNGSINITVSPSTAGIPDPNPAKPKMLKVDVTLNGAATSYSIPDGKKFTLSAPAKYRDSNAPIKDSVASVGSTFMTGIGKFIYFMFWFSTTFLVMDFGESKFGTGGKWVFAGLSFFMPIYFPVILMPVGIFWWRLFSSSDVY